METSVIVVIIVVVSVLALAGVIFLLLWKRQKCVAGPCFKDSSKITSTEMSSPLEHETDTQLNEMVTITSDKQHAHSDPACGIMCSNNVVSSRALSGLPSTKVTSLDIITCNMGNEFLALGNLEAAPINGNTMTSSETPKCNLRGISEGKLASHGNSTSEHDMENNIDASSNTNSEVLKKYEMTINKQSKADTAEISGHAEERFEMLARERDTKMKEKTSSSPKMQLPANKLQHERLYDGEESIMISVKDMKQMQNADKYSCTDVGVSQEKTSLRESDSGYISAYILNHRVSNTSHIYIDIDNENKEISDESYIRSDKRKHDGNVSEFRLTRLNRYSANREYEDCSSITDDVVDYRFDTHKKDSPLYTPRISIKCDNDYEYVQTSYMDTPKPSISQNVDLYIDEDYSAVKEFKHLRHVHLNRLHEDIYTRFGEEVPDITNPYDVIASPREIQQTTINMPSEKSPEHFPQGSYTPVNSNSTNNENLSTHIEVIELRQAKQETVLGEDKHSPDISEQLQNENRSSAVTTVQSEKDGDVNDHIYFELEKETDLINECAACSCICRHACDDNHMLELLLYKPEKSTADLCMHRETTNSFSCFQQEKKNDLTSRDDSTGFSLKSCDENNETALSTNLSSENVIINSKEQDDVNNHIYFELEIKSHLSDDDDDVEA